MPDSFSSIARRNPTLGVLVFYSVLATAALLLVLVRGSQGPGLTPGQADREAERLATLVRHTRVEAPGHEGPVHLTWTPAPGGYRALALLPQWLRDAADAGPEVHLALRLTLEHPALLRNPARLPLPSATLHREPPASDLVEPGHPRRLSLVLAPAGGEDSGPVVAVDNVLGPSGRAAATAVGRAWAKLADPGSSRFEPEELRVLAVLRRTLRGRICDDLAVWSSCRDTALALSRGHGSATYRVTLMDPSGAPEAVPFELRLTSGDGGRPPKGTLRPLPGATLTRPANLFVLPPRGSLDVVTPGDPGLVIARYRPGDPASGERWRIDFRTLLEGTEW